MAAQQLPSIGRIVHYVSRGSKDGVFAPECRAAIVTEVGTVDGQVGLCVVNPTGLFFHSLADGGITYSENNEPGTWHWPERVG